MTIGSTGERPTERSFGLTMGGVCLALAAWLLWNGRLALAAIAACAALVLAGAGLFRPAILSRPNLLWFRLGILLNRIVSPVVLGIMFFVLVTPFGLVRRLAGADPMRLRSGADRPSYWLPREKASDADNAGRFARQF